LPHDLTVQQLRVLAVIGGSPGISGHALGQALGVSDPTASGLVERLAERALISRREDPADRRVRRLCLTTTGAEVLADVDSVSRRVMELLLPRLAMSDLRQLNRLYAVMLDALGAED
jgi:DNA-binding MarR family transcriptional regulator